MSIFFEGEDKFLSLILLLSLISLVAFIGFGREIRWKLFLLLTFQIAKPTNYAIFRFLIHGGSGLPLVYIHVDVLLVLDKTISTA